MNNWVNVSKQYLPLLGSTAPGKTLPAFVEIPRKFRGRPLAVSIKRKAKTTLTLPYLTLLRFLRITKHNIKLYLYSTFRVANKLISSSSQNMTLRVMFFETIRNDDF